MKTERATGIVCAILSAAAFGTNPLFALPLYARGMSTANVLLFRPAFASALLGLFMLATGKSFRIDRRQLIQAMVLGQMLALTCLFLFLGFRVMDAGIVATILFLYPLMVALVMRFGFREHMPRRIWICLFMAFGGVVLLCRGGDGGSLSTLGVVYGLLSALAYALYIVWVKVSDLKKLASETLTFYALVFSIPLFLAMLRGGIDIKFPTDLVGWLCVSGLALFPSLMAFLLVAVAVRRIGATVSSMFGVCEPLTSIIIGVLVFGEALTPRIVCGIAVILLAVTLASFPEKRSEASRTSA